MMRTWEENIKPRFGNNSYEDYEVEIAGVPDNPEKCIEDGFHTMEP
jgi:hypothetical protein